MSPFEIAQQLTLLQYTLLRNLNPREMLHQNLEYFRVVILGLNFFIFGAFFRISE